MKKANFDLIQNIVSADMDEVEAVDSVQLRVERCLLKL
eukprot:SAG31_NODE_46744_length_253_cov_0.668831_1_plen_37_part_01